MKWHPYSKGGTIQRMGSEGGIISRDEEHVDGARITLERLARASPFAITCAIYGYLVHTAFFDDADRAEEAFIEMRSDLERLLALSEEALYEATELFVKKWS